MSWGLQTNSATANFENWMAVAEELAALGISVVSLYNRRLLDRRADAGGACAATRHPDESADRGQSALAACRAADSRHAAPAGRSLAGDRGPELDRYLGRRRMPRKAPIRCGCCGARPRSRRCRFVDSRERWKIRCFGRLADLSQRRQPGELGSRRRRDPQDQDAVRLSAAEGRPGRQRPTNWPICCGPTRTAARRRATGSTTP